MIISNIGYGLFVCLLAIRIYVGINFLDKEPRTCEVCGVDHDSSDYKEYHGNANEKRI